VYLANICSNELIWTQDWSIGCLGLHPKDPNSISEKKSIYLKHTILTEPRLLKDHILNISTHFKQCAVAAAAVKGAAYSPKPNI
jgi:hypothetical protein